MRHPGRSWRDRGSFVRHAVFVLLLGLLVSQCVSYGIYFQERSETLADTVGRHAAERIGPAIERLEAAAPADRPAVVRGLGREGVWVSWGPDSAIAENRRFSLPARLLRGALADSLPGVAPERLRVAFADDETTRGEMTRGETTRDETTRDGPPWRRPGRFERWDRRHHWPMARLLVSVRLSDGSWANFGTRVQPFPLFWSMPVFGLSFAATLVVVLLSIWAVRRASRPLTVLAQAAERLGLDVNAAPLDESGPREVRRAARAFNEMQARLKGLIHDRTQMLAAISHDLRTPITRLRLRAEFVDDPEQQRKLLADLDEMEAMIAATLSFARDDAGQESRRDLDLAALLQALCDDSADLGRDVAFDGPAHAPFLGRPMALKRAFANLVDNAVTYGGRARVALETAGDGYRVTVDDDGPGIPPGESERVFAPFHRVERSRSRETGGIGLGLAVVRSIVRGHGGEVTVSNRDGGGLRAAVVLPQLSGP